MLYSLLNTMENLNIKSLEFLSQTNRGTWEHVPVPLIGPKHEVIMLEHLSLVQNQEKQEVTLLFVQTDICVTLPLIGSDQELHLICYWSGQQQPEDFIG